MLTDVDGEENENLGELHGLNWGAVLNSVLWDAIVFGVDAAAHDLEPTGHGNSLCRWQIFPSCPKPVGLLASQLRAW